MKVLSFCLWLCRITWLIFDGKILRNSTHFARLQTTEGMLPCKTLVFLVFFSSIYPKAIFGINQPFSVTEPCLFRLVDGLQKFCQKGLQVFCHTVVPQIVGVQQVGKARVHVFFAEQRSAVHKINVFIAFRFHG